MLSSRNKQRSIRIYKEQEGINTKASGYVSHAEGLNAMAGGVAAHSEGSSAVAMGDASHAEGFMTMASGGAAHAEGGSTNASGEAAHAEGHNTVASGSAAHAEGGSALAAGDASHAEGFGTSANGAASHAEGKFTTASANFSHAEGSHTIASGTSAHAEGNDAVASGDSSHAEGSDTLASGVASHAEGNHTVASGDFSHAEGEETNTAGFSNSHIMGRYGDAEEAHSWFIGNGTDNTARGLGAKWLASNGEMYIDGAAYNANGADYAEMFETADGNPIDVGYFLTIADEDKIRVATAEDSTIIGISSATPSVVGNSAELGWQGRYVLDEWGRRTYREVLIPEKRGTDGSLITPARKEVQPVINPDWNSEQLYVPRRLRQEWVAVGMLGKILARDDGSCVSGGFCRPNQDGIATKAESGYLVLKRTGGTQVLVLLVPHLTMPAKQAKRKWWQFWRRRGTQKANGKTAK